ncbi:hypothetical protein HHI36_006330 [Cryptolaemus montrouzieri]|uniref:Uncharacterized protein n=1 Tax=Cryptolaemus montrouzieri TaxID=559131 RepID=A0ABD2NX92_9CUCU
MKLLRKLKDSYISREISEILPFMHKNSKVFNSLLLSNPGLPEEDDKKMMLLAFLGTMMPSFADDLVLEAACIYGINIVEALQRNPKCVDKFTTCASTINYLIDSLAKRPVKVSKEVLYLLRRVICVQLKHKHEIEKSADMDLTVLLKDSLTQNCRYLSTLPIMLSARVEPLLKLTRKSILTLLYNIFDISECKGAEEIAIKSIQMMITKYEWLAFSSSISSFISVWCSLQLDKNISKTVLNLVISWLKVLMKYPKFLRPMIPYYDIQSFMVRSGHIHHMVGIVIIVFYSISCQFLRI